MVLEGVSGIQVGNGKFLWIMWEVCSEDSGLILRYGMVRRIHHARFRVSDCVY